MADPADVAGAEAVSIPAILVRRHPSAEHHAAARIIFTNDADRVSIAD